MNNFEIIEFSLFGLHLQEPVALITNWLIGFFSFYAFFKIDSKLGKPFQAFKSYYLVLGCSMILGGLGHAFFHYFSFEGKIPSWILGTLSGYYVGMGILFYWKNKKEQEILRIFLIVKSFVLLILAIFTLKFIFISIDVIITYLLYTGYLAFKIAKNSLKEMNYFVWGVIVLFPSAFIFLLKISIHKYFNKDDFSHVLMLSCIVLFYLGIQKLAKKESSD